MVGSNGGTSAMWWGLSVKSYGGVYWWCLFMMGSIGGLWWSLAVEFNRGLSVDWVKENQSPVLGIQLVVYQDMYVLHTTTLMHFFDGKLTNEGVGLTKPCPCAFYLVDAF